jgi:hypothetical protein
MGCGAPEIQAPSLMSHDHMGHCFFSRQPTSQEETEEAILGLWVSCCGAVRYRGQNPETIFRLGELGLAHQCDHQLEQMPKRVIRNHVSFEFENTGLTKVGPIVAQEILECLSRSLTQTRNGIGDVREFQASAIPSSFRYHWGLGSQPNLYSIVFRLELPDERRWLLRILTKLQAPPSPSTYTKP